MLTPCMIAWRGGASEVLLSFNGPVVLMVGTLGTRSSQCTECPRRWWYATARFCTRACVAVGSSPTTPCGSLAACTESTAEQTTSETSFPGHCRVRWRMSTTDDHGSSPNPAVTPSLRLTLTGSTTKCNGCVLATPLYLNGNRSNSYLL